MNLSTFVRTECCNLRKSDSACWADDATYPKPNPCLVMAGERCPYFEKCVLPIADQPVPDTGRFGSDLRQERRQARD